MFEKLFHSRLNEIADWIIRLIMLNVMMILFSLPVITAYASISSGYHMFYDYVNKKNPKLFKDFFLYFKQGLGKKILMEVIIIIVFLLGYLNVRYYKLSLEIEETTFLYVGYYISLALCAIWYVVMIYSLLVSRAKKALGIYQTFKLSFYLAGKYYFTTLALVVISISPLILLFYPTAVTSLLFVFFGISLSLLLNVLLTRNVSYFVEGLGETNGQNGN